MRYRYTGRYGRRRKAVPAVLAAVLTTIIGGTAFTYYHHSHQGLSADFIIAPTATQNEPGATISAGVLQMLRSAGLASNNAYADVVYPGTPQPDTFALTPFLPNGQVDWGPTRSHTLDANITAVKQAVERATAQGPFDLLATITAAIKALPAPATLIVISSGLSTAGGLDLRQVGWDASPRWVAAQLKARGLLPDLAGYRIVFSGLGDTANRQPALPLPQQTTLATYWLAICRAAEAASCRIDETARPEPPSRSRIGVPVVPVPKVVSVHWPGRGITTSLPDTLLFAFNSWVLVPSADAVLRPIAQRARRQHLLVSILGTASPDGGTSTYNHNLSVRRAGAVRDRLIALGLPQGQIVHVTGVGTAGYSRTACLVHGQTDEAICKQLRHVVISMTPAAATS
jgi:outer membrane protein OmpA-like peptidoglycan-associated protein